MNVLGFCFLGLVVLWWTFGLFDLYIFPICLWMLLVLAWPLIYGSFHFKNGQLFTRILQWSTFGLAVLLPGTKIIQKDPHIAGGIGDFFVFIFTLITAFAVLGYYRCARNLGLLSKTSDSSKSKR